MAWLKKKLAVSELWAHLEGDVIKLPAVAEGRSAGIDESGGRSGGGGQTFPRPPAARRRLGALGATLALHCLLPGHGSDDLFTSEQFGIKKRKKENWLSECGRVWHWREWLFLPILFRVELRSRREKFTCASKPWLCVKRELETVRWMTKKNCKARQLSSRRSSWVTVNLRSGSQCKQLSLSLSSLSRVVALGARGGTVVSVRVRRKSTLKRKSYAYLKTSVYTYKCSLSEVRIRAVIEVYIFWWWLKRWVGTDWALKQFECSIQTRCFFLFF